MLYCQQITILGTGYVGLVSGGILANMGNSVICADTNQEKINNLCLGKIPIYEPELEALIAKNVVAGRLTFSSNISQAIDTSTIIIIAVGTPIDEDNTVDLTALHNAVEMIGSHLQTYKIICIKSTVPIGTNSNVTKKLQLLCGHNNFAVISNPEFLREGSAISDFLERNPIVLGSDSEQALSVIECLYAPIVSNERPVVKTNPATAELIKYAWNTFSSLKISYVNELARLCNKIGADIDTLVLGISYSDDLLPMRAAKPGPGIGGSCLPKDTRAFTKFIDEIGLTMNIAQATVTSDQQHKDALLKEVYNCLNNSVYGKTVAILGLSFKANTDDIRTSVALHIAQQLLQDEARIQAYDPHAMGVAQSTYPEIMYCNNAYQAATDADFLMLMTDWDEFKDLDLTTIATLMKQPLIFDTRNIWAPKALQDAGFIYKNLGRIA